MRFVFFIFKSQILSSTDNIPVKVLQQRNMLFSIKYVYLNYQIYFYNSCVGFRPSVEFRHTQNAKFKFLLLKKIQNTPKQESTPFINLYLCFCFHSQTMRIKSFVLAEKKLKKNSYFCDIALQDNNVCAHKLSAYRWIQSYGQVHGTKYNRYYILSLMNCLGKLIVFSLLFLCTVSFCRHILTLVLEIKYKL